MIIKRQDLESALANLDRLQNATWDVQNNLIELKTAHKLAAKQIESLLEKVTEEEVKREIHNN